jgi:hypothetical protein
MLVNLKIATPVYLTSAVLIVITSSIIGYIIFTWHKILNLIYFVINNMLITLALIGFKGVNLILT